MKLLIVDDDPTTREILRNILTARPGCQVTVAADGKKGWELLDDPGYSFDVVFLDLMMPEPDGFEVLRRIRASSFLQSLKVVLLTGVNDRASVTRAIQLGARHYLVKPCNEGLINAKLDQIQPREKPGLDRVMAGVT